MGLFGLGQVEWMGGRPRQPCPALSTVGCSCAHGFAFDWLDLGGLRMDAPSCDIPEVLCTCYFPFLFTITVVRRFTLFVYILDALIYRNIYTTTYLYRLSAISHGFNFQAMAERAHIGLPLFRGFASHISDVVTLCTSLIIFGHSLSLSSHLISSHRHTRAYHSAYFLIGYPQIPLHLSSYLIFVAWYIDCYNVLCLPLFHCKLVGCTGTIFWN